MQTRVAERVWGQPLGYIRRAAASHSTRLAAAIALVPLALQLIGCDNAKSGAGGTLQRPASGERWTIRAAYVQTSGHAELVDRLADVLRRTSGLDARKVRVASDGRGSTLYYGEYVKVESRDTGDLVFPPEYRRDIELIRRIAVNQTTPFFYAEPELVDKRPVNFLGEYDVSTARGAYTLLIAVFYNVPGFTQRQEAATQYVTALRSQGIPAYYRHEQLRSYVFVGDFDATDVVQTRDGPRLGPNVEEFIKRNEKEFRNVSENGQIIRRTTPSGELAAPLSYLVPVPKGQGFTPAQNPSAMPPAGPMPRP